MCQQQLKVEPSSTPGYTDLQTIVHSPCIARRLRRRLRDVSVTRGTDAAFEHQLLLAKVKLKLMKHTSKNRTNFEKRFNTPC